MWVWCCWLIISVCNHSFFQTLEGICTRLQDAQSPQCDELLESLNSLLQVCYGWWVSECYSVLTINLYILSVLRIMARLWAGRWENQGLVCRESRDFCFQTSCEHHPTGTIPSVPHTSWCTRTTLLTFFMLHYFILHGVMTQRIIIQGSSDCFYIPSLYLKLFSSLCNNENKNGFCRSAPSCWHALTIHFIIYWELERWTQH